MPLTGAASATAAAPATDSVTASGSDFPPAPTAAGAIPVANSSTATPSAEGRPATGSATEGPTAESSSAVGWSARCFFSFDFFASATLAPAASAEAASGGDTSVAAVLAVLEAGAVASAARNPAPAGAALRRDVRASSSAAGDAGDVRRAARIRPKPAIANAMIKAKAQFRSRNVPSEVPGCAPVVVPVAVMGATEAGGWASATCCSTAGVAAGLAAGVCSAACGDGLDADCSTPEGCAPVAVEAEAA